MISPKKKPGTKKSREQKKLDLLLKKVKKLKKKIKSLKRIKKRSKKKESILEKKLNNINNYYDYEGERETEEREMGTEERERKPGYSDNDERFIGSLSELRQSLSETSSTNKGKGVKIVSIRKISNKKEVNEKWSQKYKKSINCSNPQGFSQRAHCQGKKKRGLNEDEEKSERILKNAIKKILKKELKSYSYNDSKTKLFIFGDNKGENCLGYYDVKNNSLAYDYKIMDLGNPLVDETEKKHIESITLLPAEKIKVAEFLKMYNEDGLGHTLKNVDFWVRSTFTTLSSFK